MKIGSAEFKEDPYVPGYKPERPIRVFASEDERADGDNRGRQVVLSLGDHAGQGIAASWLVITIKGEIVALVPEHNISVLHPLKTKAKAETKPEQGARK